MQLQHLLANHATTCIVVGGHPTFLCPDLFLNQLWVTCAADDDDNSNLINLNINHYFDKTL